MTPDNERTRPEKFRTPNKKRRRDKGSGGLFTRERKLRSGRIVLDWVAAINLKKELGDAWRPDLEVGGKRGIVEVSSTDRAECLEKRDKLIDELRAGILPISRGTTIGALMWHWLDDIKKPHLGPGTYSTYRATLRNQIEPAIGHIDRKEFGTAHVRFLHQYVLDDGKAARTSQIAYDRLAQACDDLSKEIPPLLRVNPCVAVQRPDADSKVRDIHDTEQARQVLRTARAKRLMTRWAVAYMMGPRQAECLGLEDERIDLDKGIIDWSWQLKRLPLKPGADPDDPQRFDVPKSFVHRPVYRGHALTRVKGSTGKKNRAKITPIPDPLGVLLENYLKTRAPNEHGLTWVDTDGHPIDAPDDLEAWYALLEEAGVKRITLHGARHTCNSLLMEMGVLEDVRRQILGQSTVTAQRIYQHLSVSAARKALGNLDILLQAG